MMSFRNIIFFAENPVKFFSIGYIACSVLYLSTLSFKDSSKALNDYNEGKLGNKSNSNSNIYINSEWSAAKYGAYKNFSNNFFTSIIWPFSMVGDIIPYIVVAINKKTTKNK